MCEINAILKKEGEELNKGLFLEWMAKMAWSYKRNSDGIGTIFIKQDGIKVIKAIDIEDFFSMKKELRRNFYESKAIIGHTRLATSGIEELKNTHPIKKVNKSIVIVHNGVISSLARGDKSDTYNLMLKINKEYENNGNNTIKAIKEVFRNLDHGTYSIFIINKDNGRVFYLKNEGTTINIERIRDKNITLISTKKGIYSCNTKGIKINLNTLYEWDFLDGKLKNKGKLRKVRSWDYNYNLFKHQNNSCYLENNKGKHNDLGDYYKYLKEEYY